MPKYMMTYLGGDQPSSPEEGKQHMSKYMDWLASLGDSAVSPANPLKDTRTVNSDGTVKTGGITTMSGYTIIEVDSMEAALSIAKACPFLDVGGSLDGVRVSKDAKPKINRTIAFIRTEKSARSCLTLIIKGTVTLIQLPG